MAVTSKVFGLSILAMLNKEIDWGSDTIKVSLHTSSFTPDQDTMDYQSDLTNEVASGGGYTTGGATLSTPTIGYTSGTNVIKLDAADTSWTSATFTARYAVIYDSTPGSAATNPIIGYVDFGEDKSVSAGTFTITWDSAGIFTFTVA
jgi:hypothetical protein